MPLTFAHPAAVLPLLKVLGRFGVPSALIIGSMAPDFVYFAPLGIHGSVSHSVSALFWFCLPSGMLLYFLLHRWLKQPLMSLLPFSVRARITHQEENGFSASLPALVFSVLLGALTHIAWDSLTHAKSPWQLLRPMLDYEVFSIGSYQVFVFRLLQHTSTVFGLAFIAWWVRRWYLSSRPINSFSVRVPSRAKQMLAFVAVGIVAVIAGSFAGYSAIGHRSGLLALQFFSVKAIVTAVQVFAIAFIFYCIWWHSDGITTK